MKKFKIITLENKEEWNKIVKSFNEYEVFYLAEYVEAFKNNGDGEPYLFYYNDGKTKAINVFMKRDINDFANLHNKIPDNKYFDISTPYGYGGFIIEGEDYKKVNKEYAKYCKASNIICEFVRFNLFSDYQNKYNGEVEKIKHNIIRKIDMSPEKMLMDFEHKVRKNIKKANANNLQIQIDKEGKTIENFLDIYYKTMKRNSAEKIFYFDKQFFYKLNEMKDNVAYFNVIYDEKIISTEMVLLDSKNAYSYLGGTLEEYFELRPNDFLKYEIIKWLYQNKIDNFVLGGGYGREDDGIFRYKKSFAPNDGKVDFSVGKNIFNKRLYKKLVNLRKKEEGFDSNSKMFPLYKSKNIRENNKIIIIGAGGLGKDISWMIERINNVEHKWKIIGFVDDGVKKGTIINNYEVLGGIDVLYEYDYNTNIVIAVGKAKTRKSIYDKIDKIGKFNYPNLIDPNAIFDKDVKLGKGNTIAAGTIATVNIQLGNFNVINTSCTIGHDTCMKNFNTVYPGANVSGNVDIGECIEIGSGSQIIQGINISNNSIIGMGAVVIRDVQEETTVVGVPAKNIRDKKEKNEVE